ncbi:MAG: methyltransferase domain-containing protein [Verrucomicrobia bacterium]|nr:methyltransferase domain-containing protein [Verrucomicrobiota bacterium]
MKEKVTTSWESSHSWYDRVVGEKGHYYHQSVIIPGIIRLLDLKPGDKLLDVACGQGILARSLPKGVDYVGIDASPSLITAAQQKSKQTFLVADATKPFPLEKESFSAAAIILALQNIERGDLTLEHIALHMKKNGRLLLVLSHPCFRIPRQSSWGIDEAKKLQYRRIDRYLTPLAIPIQTHPGQKDSVQTTTFHQPLSTYTEWLYKAGFAITKIEEWVSDKKSTGAAARMENRAREEFPLFLALLAQTT